MASASSPRLSQDSAAVAGNWTTSLDSQSSIRHRIIDVTEGKEAEYSS